LYVPFVKFVSSSATELFDVLLRSYLFDVSVKSGLEFVASLRLKVVLSADA
jgi:hypothetical protein